LLLGIKERLYNSYHTNEDRIASLPEPAALGNNEAETEQEKTKATISGIKVQHAACTLDYLK